MPAPPVRRTPPGYSPARLPVDLAIARDQHRPVATATSIEWTETTWNPVRGCARISSGCEHCYAERMAHRFSGAGKPFAGLTRPSRHGPRWTGEVMLVHDTVRAPLGWRSPRVVFVNSMSDLFHDAVPESFIGDVFETMRLAPQHTFQILTKRAERLSSLAPRLPWPRNVWMGVSIESNDYVHRADRLRETPAAIKFLSLEPLLDALSDLELGGIDWAIIGGESGPGARSMDPAWVRGLRERCVEAGVPFFFKQWGGTRKSATGRTLDGRTYDEMPADARVGKKDERGRVALRVWRRPEAER